MQSPANPSEENTYILDAEMAVEMTRLLKQDRLLTRGMGGLLPASLNLSSVHSVLDIACGPGGWALDIAFAHPEMQVVGIDINERMITYARSQAQVQGLDNVSFRLMDALKPLDFPAHSFDLVNARFLVGFMPKTAWPVLLQECSRILRPGGVICFTEFDEPGTTNSPAFEEWRVITFRAIRKAGLTTAPDARNFGITPLLRSFLQEAGFQNIDRKAHVIDFSFGTPAYESMYENCEVAFELVQPFLIKMQVITQEEANQKYRQMLAEMRSQDFCGLWYYLTAWGQKPA